MCSALKNSTPLSSATPESPCTGESCCSTAKHSESAIGALELARPCNTTTELHSRIHEHSNGDEHSHESHIEAPNHETQLDHYASCATSQCCGKQDLLTPDPSSTTVKANDAGDSCCSTKSDPCCPTIELDRSNETCCPSATKTIKSPGKCGNQILESMDAFEHDKALERACHCCITSLLQIVNANPSAIRNFTARLHASIRQIETNLRECCSIYGEFLGCEKKACCYETPSEKKNVLIVEEPVRKQTSSQKAQVTYNNPLKKQLFAVEGMDCSGCISSITNAASRLPEVTNINADFVLGTLVLEYNPERLQPESIARFIARATGFTVTVSDTDENGKTRVILPIVFASAPPSDNLAVYGDWVVPQRRKSQLEGYLRLSPVWANTPRKILEELSEFDPQIQDNPIDSTTERITRDLKNIVLRTLVMIVLAIPVLVLTWGDFGEGGKTARHGAAVGLATLIWLGAYPIHTKAIRELIFLRQTGFNLLIMLSTTSAWAFSVVAFAFEQAGKTFYEDSFFETVALLIVLIYLGQTVQALTRKSTSSVFQQLSQMQPRHANLIDPNNSEVVSVVDTRLLHIDDTIRVFEGEKIPTDGVVINGRSEVDESAVTGESVPAKKNPGSGVMAGTINMAGTIDIAIGALVHENSLARMSALVKAAQASRPKSQDWVDKVSSVILPTALGIAGITFFVWSLVGVYVRHYSVGQALVNAFTYAISVVIVSCPCALGLSLPLVSSTNLVSAVKEGLLIRSASALEEAGRVDIIAFDKTRTLTTGVLSVRAEHILDPLAEGIILPMVEASNHPVSNAIKKFMVSKQKTTGPNGVDSEKTMSLVDSVEEVPGKGLIGSLGGLRVRVGSERFTESGDHPVVKQLLAEQLTLLTISLAGELVAAFGLSDEPRDDAAHLVKSLRAMGKEVAILSGDVEGAVDKLAKQVGVEPDLAFARCLPSTKERLIEKWQGEGKAVCFVGDGTNDGPALARANLSIAVSGGTDLAQSASQVILLSTSLFRSIMSILEIGRNFRAQAMGAIGWAVLYNLLAILFASGVMVNVRLEPRWAGIGELGSVLPIIAIAMMSYPLCKRRTLKFNKQI